MQNKYLFCIILQCLEISKVVYYMRGVEKRNQRNSFAYTTNENFFLSHFKVKKRKSKCRITIQCRRKRVPSYLQLPYTGLYRVNFNKK